MLEFRRNVQDSKIIVKDSPRFRPILVLVLSACSLRLKGRSHVTEFIPSPIITDRMGDKRILSVIQPVTMDTILNNNVGNIGDGLNFVTCERSLAHSVCYSARHH